MVCSIARTSNGVMDERRLRQVGGRNHWHITIKTIGYGLSSKSDVGFEW